LDCLRFREGMLGVLTTRDVCSMVHRVRAFIVADGGRQSKSYDEETSHSR
jgi:hypothetical protein